MNNSLYIAAAGMQAQQLGLDTIANNLTNLSTPGFKSGTVNFQELMYQEPATQHASNGEAGVNLPIGGGVAIGSISKDFSQGQLSQTGQSMDIAIRGGGLLEVSLADGSRAYTRGGTLHVNKDGYLTGPQGFELRPSIRLPSDLTSLTINDVGQVFATSGASQHPTLMGQLELVNFTNPGALKPLGDGSYAATEASGKPTYGHPGESGLGNIAQGALESSNVNMVNQMVALMLAQRAYELGSKVIQTSDELMSLTNNLRR